jgi:lysophospholipase L1-like esterase
MPRRKLLIFSLILNVVLLTAFIAFAIIYRDKILQRFVSIKGNPTIIMYGNSITTQGKWVELLGRTDVLNHGLPGQPTYQFLKLFQSHVIALHPKICFLEGGINDITFGVSQERIRANFIEMLQLLENNNIVPVLTLTPYEFKDAISKSEVDSLNHFLMNYCAAHQITTIDLNQYISDSTGLKAEYAVDKTHLNVAAYQVWSKEISRVLREKGI